MSQFLVVDAPVVVDLLAQYWPQPIADLLCAPGAVLAAPELMEVEALQALRKLDLAGAIPASPSRELIRGLRGLRIRTFRHARLLDSNWARVGHDFSDARYATSRCAGFAGSANYAMNLLKKLQRRNVIRMAGLYLVGAWLIV